MGIDKINLAEKFAAVDDHWHPRIVAELNGQHVRIAKLSGEFEWHHHDQEDELFWLVRGELEIHLRDKIVRLSPGELVVIPRGVEHKPVAPVECEVVLFEPAATRNTGETISERTHEDLRRI